MKAVQLKEFGGPEQLFIGDWETPTPKANEILVKVHASALNRADTLQRMGRYPAPKGDSPILGLEMAGEVAAVGSEVSLWKVGDKVCSLLGGGGYAEFAVTHEAMALPIPSGWTFAEAAAIPEVFLTAFQALVWLGKLQEGERILVHAGASGVGTAAIQLAKLIGASSIVTASAGKHALCLDLGAEHAIDYKSEDFAEAVNDHTKGQGVNMVLDFLAAPYFQRNLNSLSVDGRLVILALMGGIKTEEVNMAPILRKRLQIIGSTLRSRTLDYKIALTKALKERTWDAFEQGQLKPVVDSVFSWEKVADAHRYMEANKNKGKIILDLGQ
jgi:putative PIG3 family NAD(P)H quinone oxidoreductase